MEQQQQEPGDLDLAPWFDSLLVRLVILVSITITGCKQLLWFVQMTVDCHAAIGMPLPQGRRLSQCCCTTIAFLFCSHSLQDQSTVSMSLCCCCTAAGVCHNRQGQAGSPSSTGLACSCRGQLGLAAAAAVNQQAGSSKP